MTLHNRLEWQPIETAPKDQSAILLWIPELFGTGKVMMGFWRTSLKRFGFYGSFGGTQEKQFQPTHWMPLPAPPQVQS